MEDFATIIWLLVVIGAAIASRSRKARSRSMEPEPSGTERTRPADTVSHPTPAKETAWPQIPGFPDLSPRRAPAPQKSAQSVGPAAKSVNPAAKTEKHRPAGQKQGSAFRKREGNSRTTQPGNAVPAGNTTQGGQTHQAPCARRRRYRDPRSMRPPRPKLPQISTSAGPLYMRRF